jgi:hypothetical protein
MKKKTRSNLSVNMAIDEKSVSKFDSAPKNKEKTFSVHGRGSLGVQEEASEGYGTGGKHESRVS